MAQEESLETFSLHQTKILLTTSKVDRGYDNSCLELVVLDGVPPNFKAKKKEDKYTTPNKPSFLHRVGRVGRYGKRGVAVVVCYGFC